MRGLLAVPYSEAARGSSPERKKNHPLGSAQHHLPCDDEDEDDDGDDDLIDLYFELCGTNMLHKKQIIHTIYNEVTASGKQGSSNVNNMFCALEC